MYIYIYVYLYLERLVTCRRVGSRRDKAESVLTATTLSTRQRNLNSDID